MVTAALTVAARRIVVYNWPHLLMSTSGGFIGHEMRTSSFLTTKDKSETLNLEQTTVFILGPFLDVGCFNKLCFGNTKASHRKMRLLKESSVF